MPSLVHEYLEESVSPRPLNRAAWFFAHTAIALGAWLGLMLVGYAINPPRISQWAILGLSFAIPLVVGSSYERNRHDEIASHVWLVGLIWALVICLHVLGLPTGPNACFQCDATDKLTRTFLSVPRPSGLLDNDGPFLATWPTAALVGYSIGAWFAFRRKN
jgi:hypothetical protein